MKVICTKLPPAPNGASADTGPWLTVDAEYQVVSVLDEPGRQVQLQIITDDGRSLAWFGRRNS